MNESILIKMNEFDHPVGSACRLSTKDIEGVFPNPTMSIPKPPSSAPMPKMPQAPKPLCSAPMPKKPSIEVIEGGVENHGNNYTENLVILPSLLLDNQGREVLIRMLKGVDLPEMSEVHEQCIYKVPPSIHEAHPQAYTPQIISIGPFHKPSFYNPSVYNALFRSMESLKLKYLRGFLKRTELSMKKDFVSKLKELENRIRKCYGEPISYDSNDFLKIIITDACFIIELFIRNYEHQNWKNDPILSKLWLYSHILNDLMLLENQLPFFVLEEIYECAGLNHTFPSFIEITTCYFHEFNKNNINPKGVSPKHFVDLLRIFLKPPSFEFGHKEQENSPIPCCQINLGSSKEEEEEENNPIPCCQVNFCFSKKKEPENYPVDHVYSASQLWEAGLVFEVNEGSECLLDLKFDDKKGVLKMPRFHVDDTTEIRLRNILAFEQCHFPDSAYIAQYLKIIDFLINTEKDVSILIEKKIIVNWMGDASSVATMINNLNNNVFMPHFNPKYKSLCNRLNAFYENPRNKYKAIFIHEYFNTPWKQASTIAAVLLIVLTAIQTICAVWSLLKE